MKNKHNALVSKQQRPQHQPKLGKEVVLECNYRNNYYGDQVCVTRLLKDQ
ncbi:MAG: hypothetical protein K6L73_11970 [Cellvibrionaceae bacterium]